MTADKVKLMMDTLLPLAVATQQAYEDLRDMESGKVATNRKKAEEARQREFETRYALVKACGNNILLSVAAIEAAKGLLILERKIEVMIEAMEETEQ